MKPRLIGGLLAAVLLAIGISACGSTSSNTDSHSSSTATSPSEAPVTDQLKADSDKDNDIEAPYDDTNNDRTLNFGHPADPAERQEIVSLLERYYKVALAENGTAACSMLYSTRAESTAEDYGGIAGPPYMRGNTCPVVMTKLFKHFHPVLAIELPKLKVARVRLEAHHALVVLSFGKKLPEREIHVMREGHVWKLSQLLDSELP